MNVVLIEIFQLTIPHLRTHSIIPNYNDDLYVLPVVHLGNIDFDIIHVSA